MAYIGKRGERWRAEVERFGLKPIYKTFRTKQEAQQWTRHIESQIDSGIYIDRTESQRTTLDEALDRYMAEIASQKSHPEQENNRIKQWKKNPLSHRTLANLRGTDFAAYRDSRRAQGLAENTIRLELQLVNHLFEIARKEWGMESLLNPLKNIRKPSGSKHRERRLGTGEYDALTYEMACHSNPYAAPAFQLAIETALRQGILFSLEWEWVDLKSRVIHIPASLRLKANKGVPAFVPLSTSAVRILADTPRSIDGRVFGTTSNAVVMIWKRSLKRLGIQNLRWHDLRHEAISRLFEKGLNPIEVRQITAHKNMNMLARYTHLTADNLISKLG